MRVEENRKNLLGALRSGIYKKGTIRSDERGVPVIETKEDDDGHCVCGIIIAEHVKMGGRFNFREAQRALGITPNHCRFIQRELNDTDMGFSQIADEIEKTVFNPGF